MTKNNKPILSILIDEDKRVKFADLAKRNNFSMSHLVNKAIDRMLENDSVDIYRDSTVTSVGNYVDSSVGGMNRTDIEELIKSSVETIDIGQLVKSYVESHSSSVVSVDEVKQLIAASANELLELIPSDIPTLETIKAEINLSIAPIEFSIAELETYTQSQLAAVRDELKKPSAIAKVVPTTDSIALPTNQTVFTFAAFAELVGYEIPPGASRQPNKADAEPILALAGERGMNVAFRAKDKKFVVVEVANNETLRGGVSNHDTTETPNIGFKRVLDRLDREPELRARLISGLEQSLSLKELGRWLADGGFVNKKGEIHGIDAISQFKRAVEHVNAQPVT